MFINVIFEIHSIVVCKFEDKFNGCHTIGLLLHFSLMVEGLYLKGSILNTN